jgi:hypothetical protein
MISGTQLGTLSGSAPAACLPTFRLSSADGFDVTGPLRDNTQFSCTSSLINIDDEAAQRAMDGQ